MAAVLPHQEDEPFDEENEHHLATEMETGTSPEQKLKLNDCEVQKIHDLYQGIQDKSVTVYDIVESTELVKLAECLLKHKEYLGDKSRPARLWMQYVEYVKLFIHAERTGNWHIHVEKMLNLFAATGHINYAMSARLYLQQMQELLTEHRWCFTEQGFHTVRRSSRYWAGLWTDLVIEQVMMRSIKSRGGLTRGRGVAETVRMLIACTSAQDAMTTATGLQHITSEQHIEIGASRSRRDCGDMMKIQEWFNQYNPFNPNQPKLLSLSSGLTAADDDNVNCDQTEQVGSKIHKQLDNINVLDASIKRNDQVQSLNQLQPNIQVDKKKVHINPTLLFSRLIAIVQREEDMASFFEYELTTIPT